MIFDIFSPLLTLVLTYTALYPPYIYIYYVINKEIDFYFMALNLGSSIVFLYNLERPYLFTLYKCHNVCV